MRGKKALRLQRLFCGNLYCNRHTNIWTQFAYATNCKPCLCSKNRR